MRKLRIAGFDVGTSSLKVSLADPGTGKVTDNMTYPYKNYKEYSPGVIYASTFEETIKGALISILADTDLVALALDTQMYSVCAELNGEMIIFQWNSLWDKSTDKEPEIESFLSKSGCKLDTLFGAYKIATYNNDSVYKFLPYGLKEYLLRYLSGELATDYSTASAFGMFDIIKKEWNRDFVEYCGFSVEQMPKLYKHYEAIGQMRSDIVPDYSHPTIIVPGLGDGPSASYACSSLGLFCGNLGTSMASRIFTNNPSISTTSPLYTQAIDDDLYILGGISSNACSVFTWADTLGFKTLEDFVDTDDLQFIPWIHGERTPYWSSDLRGTFLGLQSKTTPEQISTSIKKAVGFTFVTIAKILEKFKREGDALIIAGGGTNSKQLVEVIASCLDTKIVILENSDYLCSLGALLSAAKCISIPLDGALEIDAEIHVKNDKYQKEYQDWIRSSQKMRNFYSES